MREIRSSEIAEAKTTEKMGFRQIKPEGGLTGHEARQFWNKLLRSETETVYRDEAAESSDVQKKEVPSISCAERDRIKAETGWSDDIVDCIQSMEQYEIYKNADLHEGEVNGRKCLLKNIDMDYRDVKTGKTNQELMADGKQPVDSKTGEKIELHHMGQEYTSPFAELAENSEHGDGKHTILHVKTGESWRQDPQLKNHYNNVQRPNHWKTRAEEAVEA